MKIALRQYFNRQVTVFPSVFPQFDFKSYLAGPDRTQKVCPIPSLVYITFFIFLVLLIFIQIPDMIIIFLSMKIQIILFTLHNNRMLISLIIKNFIEKFLVENEQVKIHLRHQHYVLSMQLIELHIISLINQIINSREISQMENHVLVH